MRGGPAAVGHPSALIVRTLEPAQRDRAQTARLLGINYKTPQSKLKEYRLPARASPRRDPGTGQGRFASRRPPPSSSAACQYAP